MRNGQESSSKIGRLRHWACCSCTTLWGMRLKVGMTLVIPMSLLSLSVTAFNAVCVVPCEWGRWNSCDTRNSYASGPFITRKPLAICAEHSLTWVLHLNFHQHWCSHMALHTTSEHKQSLPECYRQWAHLSLHSDDLNWCLYSSWQPLISMTVRALPLSKWKRKIYWQCEDCFELQTAKTFP